MSHLTPDTFIDLVDGTVAEREVVHLAECAECREQLDELRAAWALAVDVDVPEPSPWFWDQLSARVREAVAAEPRGGWAWLRPWSWPAAGFATTALVVLAAFVLLRGPGPERASTDVAEGRPVENLAAVVPLADDESFSFVADLAADVDWDSASDAGFSSRSGVERVVPEMSEFERVELQRLLTEALAGA